jgi:RimJ/RimL family protein N-acetyltransferase
VLHTERLVMRPFRESDLAAYTAVMQTPEVRRWLRLPDDFDDENAWQQMASWLGQWELRGTGQWALEDRASGQFVGRAGSHFPQRVDWPGIEIGWTLHPAHWGKGYATEAGRRAIEHTFATHDVDALFSVILPANTASQAVARRLGFSLFEVRVFRFFPSEPHGVWRLTRAEWDQARET